MSTNSSMTVHSDITTSGTDTTSYTALEATINDTSPGNLALGHQFATIFARHSVNGGTATLRMVLTDGTVNYFFQDFTIAATAVQDAVAGGSGLFICTVIGAFSANNVQDLRGAVGNRATPGSLFWKFGLTALSGGTLSVNFVTGRAI